VNAKGVSVLLGFILLMLISMIFLSVVQTSLVPSILKDVELKHMNRILQELYEMDSAIVSGEQSSINFDLGVEYPKYLFLLTPQTMACSISAEDFYMRVEGQSSIGYISIPYPYNVSKRINLSLNYFINPNYKLVYENTAIFKFFGDQGMISGEQKMFGKDCVNIYFLNTSFDSVSSNQPLELIFIPVSVPKDKGGVYVSNATIEFESIYPKYWNETLKSIMSSVSYIKDFNINGNRVTVNVTNVTLKFYYIYVTRGLHISPEYSAELYESLRHNTTPSYIVKITYPNLDELKLSSGQSIVLGVRVLDQFYNPISGAKVNATVSNYSVGYIYENNEYKLKTSGYTDQNGEFYIRFDANETVRKIEIGYIEFSANSAKPVRYDIIISPTAGNITTPYTIHWEKSKYVVTFLPSDTKKIVPMSAYTTPKVVGVNVQFATDQKIEDASFNPSESKTNNTGWVSTNLTINSSIFGTNYLKVIEAYVLSWFAGHTATIYAYKTLVWIVSDYSNFSKCILYNTIIVKKDDAYVTLKQTSNWLSGWSYRRPITIHENSGNKLTDYQVRIVLNSSNFDFSKSDGSDVRFTDSDGLTLLDYWIEKWDSVSEEAIIWVKVPDIPASGTKTIYMYYGNPSASSLSNGSAVFEFFDDLESWNGWGDACYQRWWWRICCGEVTQTSSYKYEGNYALKKQDNCDPCGGWKDLGLTLDRSNMLVEFHRLRIAGEGTDCYCDRTGVEDENGNGYSVGVCHGSQTLFIDVRDRGNPTRVGIVNIPNILSNWYIAQLILTPNQVKARILDTDYNLIGETSTNNKEYSTFTQIAIRGGRPYYVDIIKIRKYVEPEPTVSIGDEEVPTYYTSGYVKSYVKDLGQNSTIYFLQWDGSLPTGTEMEFWIRASNTTFDINSTTPNWIYVGKASDGKFFDLNIEGRYVQWNVSLTTTDNTKTPILDEVVVGYIPK